MTTRLKKSQKEAVLKWIAEGLEGGEINALAGKFKPPFEISRQNLNKYRKSRKQQLIALQKISEDNALKAGFAIKEIRVHKLSQLAELLWMDLTGGHLWLDDVKGVGTGNIAEIVEFETFNKAELESFRGVLEDIAAETGGRPRKAEITGKDGEPLVPPVDHEGFNESLNALADAVGEILSRKNSEESG